MISVRIPSLLAAALVVLTAKPVLAQWTTDPVRDAMASEATRCAARYRMAADAPASAGGGDEWARRTAAELLDRARVLGIAAGIEPGAIYARHRLNFLSLADEVDRSGHSWGLYGFHDDLCGLVYERPDLRAEHWAKRMANRQPEQEFLSL